MASVTKVGFQRDGRDLELESGYRMAQDLSLCGMCMLREAGLLSWAHTWVGPEPKLEAASLGTGYIQGPGPCLP